MATRQDFYGESQGVSTTTSTSFQDKATLTFTPDASSTYYLLATSILYNQTASAVANGKFLNTTSSTTFSAPIRTQKDTRDRFCFAGAAVETFGASPASQTYKIQYDCGTGTAGISDAAIWAFKKGANDAEAQSLGQSTTTSTTFQDKCTLTFTPATQGDYLIIAVADIQINNTSTANRAQCQVTVDGTATNLAVWNMRAATDWYTYAMAKEVNLTAASHTIKIQYDRTGSTGTVAIQNATIIAIRLSDWENDTSAQQFTRQNNTGAAIGNNNTINPTPTNKLHALIAAGLTDYDGTTSEGYWQVTERALSVVSAAQINTSSGPDQLAHSFAGLFTLAAGDYVFKQQQRQVQASTSNDTITADEVALAILEKGSRQIYSANSTSESSTTSTTLQDKGTLTFTPDASSNYLILAGGRLNGSSTIAQFEMNLLNSTAASTLGLTTWQPRNTGDYPTYFMMGIEAIGGSPVSTTYKTQYRAVTTGTAKIRDNYLTAIKLTSNDQTASSDTESTTTSTSFQDKTTLTFTPGSQGDYLIIAYWENQHAATSSNVTAQVTVDGTGVGDIQRRMGTTTDYVSYMCIDKVNLTAASHTIKIQYKAQSASTAKIKRARLAVIRLDDGWANNYYNETRTTQAWTGDVGDQSWQDIASIAQTCNAADHIILSSSNWIYSSSARVGEHRMAFGGKMLKKQMRFQPGTSSEFIPWLTLQRWTPPAYATNVNIEGFPSTSGGNLGNDEMQLSLLRIEASNTDANANPAAATATGSPGSVSTTILVNTSGNAGTAAVGSPSTTLLVPPSGVAGTGSPGNVSLVVSSNITPSGVAGTGQVGTARADVSKTITGVSATGQVGTPTASGTASVTPTGVAGTGQVGTPGVSQDKTITGVAGTGSPGNVTVTTGVQANPPGINGTGQVGTPRVDLFTTPTGVVGTGTPGTPTATASSNVTPSGVAGTGQVGSVRVDLAKTPTGVAATGQAGTPTVTASSNVTPTGVVGTGSAGNATATAATLANPPGVAATGNAGLPTVSQTVFPSGVAATGQVGTPITTVDKTITGAQATGSAGNVTATASSSSFPTGVAGTGQVGTPAVSQTTTVTGVAGTGQAGTVTASAAVQANPPGVAGTGQVGTPTTTILKTPTGVVGTGQAGNPTPSVSNSASVTGVSATGIANTVTTTVSVFPQGVFGTGQAGIAIGQVPSAQALPVGAAAVGQVGFPIALFQMPSGRQMFIVPDEHRYYEVADEKRYITVPALEVPRYYEVLDESRYIVVDKPSNYYEVQP